jgi:hypothetical protein
MLSSLDSKSVAIVSIIPWIHFQELTTSSSATSTPTTSITSNTKAGATASGPSAAKQQHQQQQQHKSGDWTLETVAPRNLWKLLDPHQGGEPVLYGVTRPPSPTPSLSPSSIKAVAGSVKVTTTTTKRSNNKKTGGGEGASGHDDEDSLWLITQEEEPLRYIRYQTSSHQWKDYPLPPNDTTISYINDPDPKSRLTCTVIDTLPTARSSSTSSRLIIAHHNNNTDDTTIGARSISVYQLNHPSLITAAPTSPSYIPSLLSSSSSKSKGGITRTILIDERYWYLWPSNHFNVMKYDLFEKKWSTIIVPVTCGKNADAHLQWINGTILIIHQREAPYFRVYNPSTNVVTPMTWNRPTPTMRNGTYCVIDQCILMCFGGKLAFNPGSNHEVWAMLNSSPSISSSIGVWKRLPNLPTNLIPIDLTLGPIGTRHVAMPSSTFLAVVDE